MSVWILSDVKVRTLSFSGVNEEDFSLVCTLPQHNAT
jgi:hypothetical protein